MQETLPSSSCPPPLTLLAVSKKNNNVQQIFDNKKFAYGILDLVRPLCLVDASDTRDFVGLPAQIAGWGKTSDGNKPMPF